MIYERIGVDSFTIKILGFVDDLNNLGEDIENIKRITKSNHITPRKL